MSTAIDVRESTVRLETKVERQLAEATRRIRIRDMLAGLFVLGTLAALYAATVMSLDKIYVLPDWLRQMGWAGFLSTFVILTYFFLLRPAWRQINPLYAARQVERTIQEAKNSVLSYVDLRERELNPHVRAALGARAAQAAAEADLDRAVDPRPLVWLGSVFGASLLLLVVLLVLFRPSQFVSLLSRAFNPFSSQAIVSRTQLQVLLPEGGDAILPSNTSLTIAVQVSGRVPKETDPDRVRAILRYSATEAAFEELPLTRGASRHEWSVQVPPHLVQNGFWYKVAAGDAETPEFRVNVRTVPQFISFNMDYEYPPYLRIAPEQVRDAATADLYGYRGTRVTLTARANREVREGALELLIPNHPPRQIPGERTPGQADTLRFPLTLQDNGTFRLSFTATTDERSRDIHTYRIEVIADLPPIIEITQPQDDPALLPLNGRLAVDATIADDFGLDSAILRLRLRAEKPVSLAPKFYNEGRSLRRESDGTYPRSLSYKDSVSLAELSEETGEKISLKKGDVIEYWLEATDNQHPKPNIGKSKVQTVILGDPIEEPTRQAQQAQRRDEEQAHRQAEQRRLDSERRDPNPGLHRKPDSGPPPSPNAGGNETQPPKPDPANANDTNPRGPQSAAPHGTSEAAQPPNGPNSSNEPGPMTKPPAGTPPSQPENSAQPNPSGSPETAAPASQSAEGSPSTTSESARSSDTADEEIRRQAEKIRQEIEKQEQRNRSAGEGKPNETPSPEERSEPGSAKRSAGEGSPSPSEPKEPEPSSSSADGASSKEQSSAQAKPEGAIQPPSPAATSKDAGDSSSEGKPPTPASESKAGTPGTVTGTDKETPQPAAQTPENSSAQGPSPENAGQGKPVGNSGPEDDNPMSPPGADPARATGQSKPRPSVHRGEDKPASTSSDPRNGVNEPSPAGSAKGDSAPESAMQKQPPGNPQDNSDGSSKTPPGNPEESGTAKSSPEGSPTQPLGQPTNRTPPGASKETPRELAREIDRKRDQQGGNGSGAPDPEDGPERLLRDKEKFQQAARDLNSRDEASRKRAEDQMDQAVGREGREAARNAARGLDSPQSAERQKAEEELDQLRKKKKDQAETRRREADEQKQRQEELTRKAQDLTSPDETKRKQAEDDLDRSIGRAQREDLQRKMQEASGGDPARQEAAQRKIEELARKPQSPSRGGQDSPTAQPTPEQIEEMKKTLEDLASDDPARRQAAEKTLDQAIGQQEREKLQQAIRELKADPEKARQALEKLAQEAQRQARDAQGPQQPEPGNRHLTQDQQRELREKLRDLQSKDPTRRAEAEKAFDQALGEDQRKQIQEGLKPKEGDVQEPREQDVAEMQKKLEELTQNGQRGNRDPRGNRVPQGSAANDTESNTPAEADPKNRLKSAELQLEQFRNKQFDKDFLKSIGLNEGEYEQFLKGYERMVERMRAEAERPEPARPATAPTRPSVNVGGAGTVDARSGPDSAATSGVSGVAPPGFSDAKKRFQEELFKLRQQR